MGLCLYMLPIFHTKKDDLASQKWAKHLFAGRNTQQPFLLYKFLWVNCDACVFYYKMFAIFDGPLYDIKHENEWK